MSTFVYGLIGRFFVAIFGLMLAFYQLLVKKTIANAESKDLLV